jgi:hypothetical protein
MAWVLADDPSQPLTHSLELDEQLYQAFRRTFPTLNVDVLKLDDPLG